MKHQRLTASMTIFLVAICQHGSANADSAVIEKARIWSNGPCAGCPAYEIEIERGGMVRYEGREYVSVIGKREHRISSAESDVAMKLLKSMRDADCARKKECAVVTVETSIQGFNSRTAFKVNGCCGSRFFVLEDLFAHLGVSKYLCGENIVRRRSYKSFTPTIDWSKAEYEFCYPYEIHNQ